VAARGLGRGGAHAFGKKALQVRRHGVIVFGDDVPVRLRLPGGSAGFCVKQVGFRNALRGPNEFLLLLRKVSAEILRAFRTQPDTSVYDVYLGEDVGLWEVGELRLGRLIGVRSECSDVDQAGNALVGSGAGDDGSAVGVANENNGAVDAAYRCFRSSNVLVR
jgi:hypothetical protein